ncbi:MAG: 4Fe-4S binding protein [Deltaproteobacteria bacterium]|nr:4Fe-4S binding protein [Deltaproteobacteria bacterium]
MSNGYGYGGGGKGQGMGRGRGRGGRGGGGQCMWIGGGYRRGFGRGQAVMPIVGPFPTVLEPRDTNPQVQALKAQEQNMKDQLNIITQRIEEIEASRLNQPVSINQSENKGVLKMTAVLDQKRCMNCGLCLDICPEQAISMSSNYTVVIDSRKCTGCGSCIDKCPNKAISLVKVVQRAAS